MDLKQTRRERLLKFAQSRGVADDPSGLGALIGKKPNQVYNLLNGFASFGEKVARSIESASGLPAGWLDLDEASGEQIPGWPFRNVTLERFLALSPEDRAYVEGKLDAAIEGCESSQHQANALGMNSSVAVRTTVPGRFPGEIIPRTDRGREATHEAAKAGGLKPVPSKGSRRRN